MPKPRTYADHSIRQSTELFIQDQIAKGFDPAWMLSFHYWNPALRGWRVSEPGLHQGHAIPTNHSVWNACGREQAMTRRRNDIIKVSADARAIRNRIIKAAWQIPDLRKHDQSQSPMIIFHEKGRSELQYHTHILMGALPEPYNNIRAIQRIWRTAVIPTTRCVSRSNSLHVKPVFYAKGAGNYLTKEITANDPVIDWVSSIPIVNSQGAPIR